MPLSGRRAAEGVEHLAHGLGQAAEVADGHEADVVVEDLVALGDQELAEQAHERVDLAGGARPVLLAEGVERERVEAEAAADPDDAAHRGAPGLVPGLARLAARLGPAAVAVHDDADVAGQVPGFDEVHRGPARAAGASRHSSTDGAGCRETRSEERRRFGFRPVDAAARVDWHDVVPA